MKWSGRKFTEALGELQATTWNKDEFEGLPVEIKRRINAAMRCIEYGLEAEPYLLASSDAGCYSTEEGFRVVLRDTPMISQHTHEDCWADITPERALSMGQHMAEDARERIARDQQTLILELGEQLEKANDELYARDDADGDAS
jgi:hypothetical protein